MSAACPKCGSTNVSQVDNWKIKLALLPVAIIVSVILLFAIVGAESALVFIVATPVLIIVCVVIALKQRGRTWRCEHCRKSFFWKDKSAQ